MANDNVSPEIKFCGFDSENNVCISIVTPDNRDIPFEELTPQEIKLIIYELIHGKESANRMFPHTEISKVNYLEKESWHFKAKMPFLDNENNDNIDISYSGYIFNRDNVLVCIMCAMPFNEYVSITSEVLNRYFTALRLI